MKANEPRLTPEVVLIMAKQPRAGHSKTRLVPPLSPQQAAGLARAMLLDTIALARTVCPRAVLAFAPDTNGAAAWFRLTAPDLYLIPQQGDALGDRLDNAIAACFRSGARRVVAIGSDSPSLPAATIRRAFEHLDAYQIVLGPSADGGYYLAGLTQREPALFRGVEMSTPTVLADTVAVAESLGLSVGLLPELYDVDVFEDLRRLSVDLASGRTCAPHTARWLGQMAAAISIAGAAGPAPEVSCQSA